MDLDGANGGGCWESSWWFASPGPPHALDFFDLEATVRERLSAAVERDATVEEFRAPT
jgi:hypothetical protein